MRIRGQDKGQHDWVDCGDDKCADLTVLHDYLYYLIVPEGQQYLKIIRIFVVLSKQWCVKSLASQSIFFSNVSHSFLLQK